MLFSFSLLDSPLDTGWTTLEGAWRTALAVPSNLVVPEEPTTLKLAFAGAITLAIYALVTGYRRRRPENAGQQLGGYGDGQVTQPSPDQREAA